MPESVQYSVSVDTTVRVCANGKSVASFTVTAEVKGNVGQKASDVIDAGVLKSAAFTRSMGAGVDNLEARRLK